MVGLDIGRLSGKSHLNTGWTPRNKLSQSAFANPKQAFMYIRGICLALDNVKDGDVAALFAGLNRNHAILWLQQATHNIQNSRLTDTLGTLHRIIGKWRVSRGQEMTLRDRDQRSNHSHQIIIHVTRISESICTSSHNRRNLNDDNDDDDDDNDDEGIRL